MNGHTPRGPLNAVKRQAAAKLAKVDVQGSISTASLKQSGLVLCAVAGVFAVYWVVSPKSVTASLLRTLGNDAIPVPTRTEFSRIEPPDGQVTLMGKPVAFEVNVRRPQGPVVLTISRNGGRTYLGEDLLTMSETDEPGHYMAQWTAAAEEGDAAYSLRSRRWRAL